MLQQASWKQSRIANPKDPWYDQQNSWWGPWRSYWHKQRMYDLKWDQKDFSDLLEEINQKIPKIGIACCLSIKCCVVVILLIASVPIDQAPYWGVSKLLTLNPATMRELFHTFSLSSWSVLVIHCRYHVLPMLTSVIYLAADTEQSSDRDKKKGQYTKLWNDFGRSIKLWHHWGCS